jgi:hypothetical protein
MKNGRPIQTVYYNHKHQVVRKNSARYAFTAVPLCIQHMQINEYGASYAEVFDHLTGELHAVIKWNVAGTITILFKREVKQGA